MFHAPDLQIDISVDGHRLAENVGEMCRIDPENMLEEIVEQCSSYAYLAMLEVAADSALAAQKKDVDNLYGELLLELAEEKEARGRNFTVAMQEATVNRTPSMIEARDQLKVIERKAKELKVLVKTFEQRKDMLSSAANWISRSETPPYIKPRPKEAVATARAKKVNG